MTKSQHQEIISRLDAVVELLRNPAAYTISGGGDQIDPQLEVPEPTPFTRAQCREAAIDLLKQADGETLLAQALLFVGATCISDIPETKLAEFLAQVEEAQS